jgi:RHS repeat-associated protein
VDADDLTVQRRRQTPYGESRGPAPVDWPTERGFVGGTQDPTGLVHLGAREYDPMIGRFISVDSLMDLTDPQQMHGYRYANNNPVSFSDPTGLIESDCRYFDCYGYNPTTGCKYGCGTPENIKWGRATGKTSTKPKRGKYVPPVRKKGTAGKLWEFAKGVVAGGHYYSSDSVIGAWSFVRDPWGAIKGAKAEADAWNAEYMSGDYRFGIFCTVTGLCQAYEDWQNGDYFAAGYGAGQFGADVAVAAATMGAGAEISAATKISRFCSFSGGTGVLLADGSTKPISEVKVGDEVMAADPETGRRGARKVTRVLVHDDYLIGLVLQGGKVITTTEDHPFWNETDGQWQRADELVGDEALDVTGRGIKVLGQRFGPAVTAPAYNLTVDDLHTYYVLAGITPVLVHNCPDDLPTSRNTTHSNLRGSERGVNPTETMKNAERILYDENGNQVYVWSQGNGTSHVTIRNPGNGNVVTNQISNDGWIQKQIENDRWYGLDD